MSDQSNESDNKRKGRGMFRYTDAEYEQAKARKDADGYGDMPFATWLRKLSLGELGVPGASQGYLRSLQQNKERAVAEAMAWREAISKVLDGHITPGNVVEKLRALLR